MPGDAGCGTMSCRLCCEPGSSARPRTFPDRESNKQSGCQQMRWRFPQERLENEATPQFGLYGEQEIHRLPVRPYTGMNRNATRGSPVSRRLEALKSSRDGLLGGRERRAAGPRTREGQREARLGARAVPGPAGERVARVRGRLQPEPDCRRHALRAVDSPSAAGDAGRPDRPACRAHDRQLEGLRIDGRSRRRRRR